MLSFVLWYLVMTFTGWLAFPLVYRQLPHLSDRGYALARTAGLLVWGFIFWLLASLQVLHNNPGGILLAALLLVLLSGLSLRDGGWVELHRWLREHKALLITTEVLFLAAFAFIAFLRANNPEASGTEKPMELAFINAILHSPTFPPHDPWLSGYAISYYYFGYVLVAMLAKLTGTPGGVAFNLGVSLVFALTAVNAFGILYSLLCRRFSTLEELAGRIARSGALLGPLFVLLISNLDGLLEMLHARGILWQQGMDGTLVSPFWKWLDIQELTSPPAQPFTWVPNRPGGIWWWRASRVLQDYNLAGQSKEIIDEFPFFSFLLADLHPHVLAMPFALLAVGLAFNFYLRARQDPLFDGGVTGWVRQWAANASQPFRYTRLGGWLATPGFWFAAVVMGGMAFLNTWDFPIYVGLFSAAYVLGRYQEEGWSRARVEELVEIAAVLILFGALLYLPFYVGFKSQAGGILPSLSFFTRGVFLWVMFAPLFIPVLIWLIYLWTWRGDRPLLFSGLKFSLGLTFGLWLASFLLAWLILIVLSNTQRFASLRELFYQLHGSPSAAFMLAGSFARRLAQPGAWMTLVVLLTLVWGLLASYHVHPKPALHAGDEAEPQAQRLSGSTAGNSFTLLLVLLGAGLVLAPEFFYLRDQFGWRMNTIFKFYYQAWIVLALAAAYASVVLMNSLKGAWVWGFRAGWAILVLISLPYPYFGLKERILDPWFQNGRFTPQELTLDSTAFYARYNPEEMEAIRFLANAPAGIVVEAVGGSYSPSYHTRVSTFSGQPTVLGWPGHESQWRGGGAEMGSRESDIQRLYQTHDWVEAEAIITRYNIRYIYIGSLERGGYRVDENKFSGHLQPVFSNNAATIYGVPDDTDIQP